MSGTVRRARFRYRDSADSTSLMASGLAVTQPRVGFDTHESWCGMERHAGARGVWEVGSVNH